MWATWNTDDDVRPMSKVVRPFEVQNLYARKGKKLSKGMWSEFGRKVQSP